MTLSKRLLMKYRKQALQCINSSCAEDNTLGCTIVNAKLISANRRILDLTQELIDQCLLEEAEKDAN